MNPGRPRATSRGRSPEGWKDGRPAEAGLRSSENFWAGLGWVVLTGMPATGRNGFRREAGSSMSALRPENLIRAGYVIRGRQSAADGVSRGMSRSGAALFPAMVNSRACLVVSAGPATAQRQGSGAANWRQHWIDPLRRLMPIATPTHGCFAWRSAGAVPIIVTTRAVQQGASHV